MTPAQSILCSFVASAALIATAAVAGPGTEGGRKFTTSLTGAAEVTNAGVPNQGDLNATGRATFTINPGQNQVCWKITTANVDAVVGAHIHVAPSTTNGPIVVNLTAVQNGTSSGCTNAARSLIDAIRKAPQTYYVNVHTTAFPGGAIRGQLGK